MFRADPNEPKEFDRWWTEYIRDMHYAVAAGQKSAEEAHRAIAEAAFVAGTHRGIWCAAAANDY